MDLCYLGLSLNDENSNCRLQPSLIASINDEHKTTAHDHRFPTLLHWTAHQGLVKASLALLTLCSNPKASADIISIQNR